MWAEGGLGAGPPGGKPGRGYGEETCLPAADFSMSAQGGAGGQSWGSTPGLHGACGCSGACDMGARSGSGGLSESGFSQGGSGNKCAPHLAPRTRMGLPAKMLMIPSGCAISETAGVGARRSGRAASWPSCIAASARRKSPSSPSSPRARADIFCVGPRVPSFVSQPRLAAPVEKRRRRGQRGRFGAGRRGRHGRFQWLDRARARPNHRLRLSALRAGAACMW